MQLQERDLEILSTISALRFMTTGQIHLLHGYKGAYGQSVTRRKLAAMERAGLLKSWQPSKYEQKIWYVTKRGAEEVTHYTGQQVKLARKSNKTLHQVAVSEVYTRLRLEKTGRLRMFALDYSVGSAICDAFVRYEIDKKSSNGIQKMVKLLFLEIDTGTESIAYIRDTKLLAYRVAYDSGEFQNKYGIFPDICFVTMSDTRKRTLIQIAEAFHFRIRVFTLDEVVSKSIYLI